MASTLAELLTGKSAEEIEQILLGVYQSFGFPVQSWQPFGVERTRMKAIATGLTDISGNYIPNIAAGGFVDYAEQLETGDWIRLLAAQLYNIPYNQASFTVGNIALTSAAGAGPYTIHDGDLIAVFAASGNRYKCASNGTQTLNANSTLTLSFTAEFAGSKYNDPSNSGALTLATPLPGVTLTNPAGTYTSVAHVGSGTGTLTLGGSPSLPHQMIVRIDSTGASGVASWSTSLDGAPFVSHGTLSSITNLSGTGINITLVDGVTGTSFVLNDTYLFNTPGSWIASQGSDDEANPALATRCRDRWSTLSPIPTNDFYELIATSTPTVGSQVTQVKVILDTVINNKVNIVVAGPAGALPPATIAAIQSYIDPRVPGTDFPVVVSPSTQAITIAGNVTLVASQAATAQNAIATAVTNYINSIGINGTVRVNAVVGIIETISGVIDVTYGSVTINGSAANLVLGNSVTFVIPGTLTQSFIYVTQ